MKAQYLVLYHQRPGGQSQFSSLLEFKSTDGRFSSLLSWIRENLDKHLGDALRYLIMAKGDAKEEPQRADRLVQGRP